MSKQKLPLFLPLGLLILRKSTPTGSEFLSNLSKGQVGLFLQDDGTSLLGEEHVAGEGLLGLG